MSPHSIPSTGPNAKPLVIAVLAEEVQLMDVTCLDLLANCSTQYLRAAEGFGSGPLLPYSTPMTVHWPSSSMKPAAMSGGLVKFQPTCTYDECPRDLDVLLIGGPSPEFRPAGADKLMKECWARTKVVMTTCVGSIWLASSGVLKGHHATTNRGFLKTAQQMIPDVKWEYARWVVEKKEGGEVWTAGGAQAGVDMVAEYVRQHVAPQLSNFAIEALDVAENERGTAYKQPVNNFEGLFPSV